MASDADLQEQLFSGGSGAVSRAQAEQSLRADPNDLAAVRSFIKQQGINITRENAQARTLRVEGTVEQLSRAFAVQMGCFEDAQGHRYLSYEGSLSLPESLSGVITAVLGLDQRPIAKHHAGMADDL